MEGTVITKKGIKLLAKILAGEGNLNITRTAVGTGKMLNGYDAESMTELVEYKMDAVIAGCVANGEVAEITIQLSSDGIQTGFLISEVGVFAEDPDEGEILYAYVDMGADPQYMYQEGGQAVKFIEIVLEIVIAEGTRITAYINPLSLIARKEFDKKTQELMDITNEHAENKENPHETDKHQVGLGNVDNTSDEDKPVSNPTQAALNALYKQLTGYTNEKIADLIGSAPSTLDTLEEIANAIQTNDNVVDLIVTKLTISSI